MNEWRPHPRQETALLSEAFETLYGGARGGGKTDAGMAWLLYPKDNPDYRALVVRRNYTDLNDWLDRAQVMYSGTSAKFVNRDEIRFASGAKIRVGHLADSKAYMKYQGHEYQRQLIEELTQIPTEEMYLKLISSCRSTNDIPARVFATCNPGGAGHYWVKKRFIDVAKPMVEYHDDVSNRSRIYIPATVDDNPTLLEKDPDYVHFLNSLPPDLKAYWRFGSWDYVKTKGAIFGDEIEQAQREERFSYAPYNPHLKVITFWDLGISKGNAQVCWFVQVDGQKINIIDMMWGENKAYDYWINELEDRKYHYRMHYLPHDGRKRAPDSLRSFEDKLKEKGWEVEVITRTKDKSRDIDAAKIIFARCHFNPEKCAKGIEGLTLYRFAWDEEKGIFSREPYHDWASNFGDAFQALAVTLEEVTRPKADIVQIMQEHVRNVQYQTPDPTSDLMARYLSQQPEDRASGF